MYHDGTPVQDSLRKIMIRKTYNGGSINNQPEEKALVDGVAAFDIEIPIGCTSLDVQVILEFQNLDCKRY